MSVWRRPGEESADIYPGLVVCDDRVTGSITIGPSRLPLWALAPGLVANQSILDEYEAAWTLSEAAEFFYCLTEQRGEFARLILELAAAERADHRGNGRAPWWETKKRRKRVVDQLKRCVACLEDGQPLPDAREGERIAPSYGPGADTKEAPVSDVVGWLTLAGESGRSAEASLTDFRHQIIGAIQHLDEALGELNRKQEALAGVVIMRGTAEEQACRRRASEMFALDEKPCPHCAGRGFIAGAAQ